jgi:hypothetical protein
MNGIQIINFTFEAIGGLTAGYLVAKWYFKKKRYHRKKQTRKGGR